MRSYEVAPDAPKEERDARRPRLDGELEQIAVGIGKVDPAGQESGRLEAEVHVLVGAESGTQHGKRAEHRQAAPPLGRAFLAVGGAAAGALLVYTSPFL